MGVEVMVTMGGGTVERYSKHNDSIHTLNIDVFNSCHIGCSRGGNHGYTCVPSTVGGMQGVK